MLETDELDSARIRFGEQDVLKLPAKSLKDR